MTYVIIENDLVVGIFVNPQTHLNGYQEIPDDDNRIEQYRQSFAQKLNAQKLKND